MATLALALCSLNCRSASRAAVSGPVNAGDVARVGHVGLSATLVASVATARDVPARDAVEALIEDALFWYAGHEMGVDRTPAVQWASTVVLGRAVSVRISSEARALGAPSDDEIASLRVVHAVVRRSPALDDEKGLFIARLVARAVAGSPGPDAFEARALAVPTANARLVVERIGPFGLDGQLPEGGELDPAFVAAAFSLGAPGDTTQVVETRFGWHVVRLVDRSIPERSARAELRRSLADAAVALRVRRRLADVIEGHRAKATVEVSGAADSIMAGVAFGSP